MKLNIEQRKIIESKPSGHMLVRGVAGSGKTTVAVHKIPFLLKHYCPANEDKILVVTFNKSLINYVKYIYGEIEEYSNENQIEFDIYSTDTKNKLDIKTIDSIIFRYFATYKQRNKLNIAIANPQEQHKNLLDAIVSISKKYNDVSLINIKNLNFIREEIMWIKACNYMNIEEYQNIDRVGRTSHNNGESPQKLRKNSKVREAIFETMRLYNELLKKNNLIDFQDMALIALNEASIPFNQKYTHIIMDEAQDLTRVQLEFIKKLYSNKPYSMFLFVADTAQSIYPQSWLVRGRSFASIGFDMKGKSNSLSKNYRTTTQIAQSAYSLISNDSNIIEDDNFVKPSLIDRQGVYPVYKGFKNKDSEAKFIIDTIKTKIKNDYEYKDIAIITKLKNQLSEIKTYLEKENIPFKELSSNEEMDFKENSIKLLTMHSIKGLEFKIVMIAGLNNKCIPLKSVANEFEDSEMIESRDRRLLYVGMTRATQELFLTSDGSPSKFIKDIDYKYLRVDNDSDFRRFHRVNIDSYEFKDKIIDLYSDEEITRQWIIDELKQTYNYPKDLIDVEYKVNIGSQRGLVDIVINIYSNKTKVPYIYIETKKWGMGIEDALSQLKSYMSSTSSISYGIATDGNDIKIINSNFEEVDDIPKFNINMMPNSLEMFEYVNLNFNRTYEFVRDSGNAKDIIVEDNDNIDVVAIPVFSEIAAGQPILINDEYNGMFYLPKEWISTPNDTFILKIKGDSMIKANIDDGDYVVIKSQNSGKNGDIVAVDIDGNSTLKRLMMMGSNVLLIPENENYEPIMLQSDEVRIIGVAVGIVKCI